MEYLKGSTQYVSLLCCKNGQADVEHGFSVNRNLIVENVSDKSRTAQRFVKHHMKCKEYKPYNMPMPKELLQSVKQLNASYKEALQTK